MMTTFRIVGAKAYHCGQMARVLRREHRQALAALGVDIHAELRARFYQSAICRAWLIDGRLAALGGVTGSMASSTGYVWVALSQEAAHYPVQIVKEARRQLRDIMTTKRELATVLVPQDRAARRLAVYLGFHLSHVAGMGEPAMTYRERHNMQRILDVRDEIRIPMGSGYVIPIGYH